MRPGRPRWRTCAAPAASPAPSSTSPRSRCSSPASAGQTPSAPWAARPWAQRGWETCWEAPGTGAADTGNRSQPATGLSTQVSSSFCVLGPGLLVLSPAAPAASPHSTRSRTLGLQGARVGLHLGPHPRHHRALETVTASPAPGVLEPLGPPLHPWATVTLHPGPSLGRADSELPSSPGSEAART